VLAVALVASAAGAARVFYLSVRVHQCLIGAPSQNSKTFSVVPCSNAQHNLEVYAIGHGMWGRRNPPANAYSIARATCLSAYYRITAHPLARTAGWYGFWADPGSESRKYGDKIVCSYRTWPGFAPLGSGWHVH